MNIALSIILGAIIISLISGAVCIVTNIDSEKIFAQFVCLIIIFLLGISIGKEMNIDIKTSNITTYTYQCQICEENTTTTNEPKVMICDKCIEAIKNMKGE